MFGGAESGPDWGHLEGKACALSLWASGGPSTGQGLDLSSPHGGQATTSFSCPESSHRPPLVSPSVSLRRRALPTQHPAPHSTSAHLIPLFLARCPSTAPGGPGTKPTHPSILTRPNGSGPAPCSSPICFLCFIYTAQWPTRRWRRKLSLTLVPERLWSDPWLLLFYCPDLSFTGILGGPATL